MTPPQSAPEPDGLFQPLGAAASELALPHRFPSPFDAGTLHPLMELAVQQLRARLEAEHPGGPRAQSGAPEGKMFAVLLVQAREGQLGALHGFSGMLLGSWEVAGFVPPLFQLAAREPWWSDAQAQLRSWDDELRELMTGEPAARVRAEWAALQRQQAAELEALSARHRQQRAARHQARRELAESPSPEREASTRRLAQASRDDTVERRRLGAAQREAAASLQQLLAELDTRHAAVRQLRAESSAGFQRRLNDLYLVPSWSGDIRPLRELFAPGAPPGGAGDCAGPKLLAYALRAGLRPLALAELWWGPSPLGGGRHHGRRYPACRGKCGPILPHMLRGLDVEEAPVFGGAPEPTSESAPEIGNLDKPSGAPHTREDRGHSLTRRAANDLDLVYEDEWLLALVKPCGLLSVPGRSAALEDSVLSRLRRRFPQATGPLLVHRLDLDTSGLLLAAKDAATHVALQRLFVHRKESVEEHQLHKRYVALLDGEVAGDQGVIELALRTDLDDRPRQMHDPVYGKPAITEWRVRDRLAEQTRMTFVPRTGRTHQLRVHAAHPLGLAAPILGDRLYGGAASASRLMLHAERLDFTHPHTGERLELVSEAPF